MTGHAGDLLVPRNIKKTRQNHTHRWSKKFVGFGNLGEEASTGMYSVSREYFMKVCNCRAFIILGKKKK